MLREKEIWALDTATHSVRFVTHCDVDRAGCERALVALKVELVKSHRWRERENGNGREEISCRRQSEGGWDTADVVCAWREGQVGH